MALVPLHPSLLGNPDEHRLSSRIVATGTPHATILGAGAPGAESSPDTRRWLYAHTTGWAGELAQLRVTDLGDVSADTPEAARDELEAAVSNAAKADAPVVFLGGTGLASGALSGLLSARPGKAAVFEVSAGLGPDGRLALERWDDRIAQFVALGVQPMYVTTVQAAAVRAHRGRMMSLDELRQAPGPAERFKREIGAAAGSVDSVAIMLSLSAASGTLAPDISSPSPDGVTADELARLADAAGRHPKVRLFALTDLTPSLDDNGGRARLAAFIVWRFLAGLSARGVR
jgi:arginase family enzyme